MCYSHGTGVIQSHKEAVKWFEKAAFQGCLEAQYNLGICYYNGEGIAKNYKKAAEWFEKAALLGG